MKKSLLIISAFLIAGAAAYAGFSPSSDYNANQGFKGGTAGYTVAPIKDVMNMYDDQITMVRGNITKQISDDKYLFKDATGEMVVEIDYKYWAGIQVDEKDTIELTGKVDKDYNSVSLDVFRVEKVK